MIYFKSCPKCKGDVHSDRDIHGPFITCIQCSHTLNVQQEQVIAQNGLLKTDRLAARAPVKVAVG